MVKRYELRDNSLTRNWEIWDTHFEVPTFPDLRRARIRARLAIVFNEETGELIRDLLEDRYEAAP